MKSGSRTPGMPRPPKTNVLTGKSNKKALGGAAS